MGMGDEILVVPRELLFKDGDFEGFLPAEKKDFLKIILNNIHYRIRTKELENDRSWQQPLPYTWLVNTKTKKVFLYMRARTGNEARLYNKYSGGVGGHIDKKELVDGQGDPVIQTFMRELEEETVMMNYPVPKVLGYINFNSGVEDMHFGIVGVAETTEDVKPAQDMALGQFYTIEEVENIFSDPKNDIEKWTWGSWPFVKDYLNKL